MSSLYNISIPSEKKNMKLLRWGLCLIDFLLTLIFFVYQKAIIFISKLIFNPDLYFYSLKGMLLDDILWHKSSFLIYGISNNNTYIESRIRRASFLKDETNSKKSSKNLFIQEELEIYKYITASNNYDQIIFSSLIDSNLPNLISDARKEAEKYILYQHKKDYGFEPSQGIMTKSNHKLSELEVFVKKHNIGKRSLILYEIEAGNINSFYKKGDFGSIKLIRKLNYLKSVYPNNLPKLSEDNIGGIIENILKPVTKNRRGWKALVSRVEKSILLAEFNNNENAKSRLVERKDNVLRLMGERY